MKTKKIILLLLLILLCACNTKTQDQLKITGSITKIDDNGNGDIDISNTNIVDYGFNYGDSVDVEFDNGYKLEDIPFLSGMYVEYGSPMVYGKDVKDTVSFIQKYKSFAENSGISVGTGFTLALNEKQKYKNIEEVGKLSFSNDYSDYNDDIKFANFREVRVGDIKEKRLYRSVSVVNDEEKRIAYSSKLALENNIKTILNIIDKQEKYDEFVSTLEGDPKKLIETSTVILAPISVDYQAEKNIKMIIEGFNKLIENDYPYLIHCLEGKDRTGYELAIIEALCGATYDEIIDDYMLTYDNFYGVNKESDADKYNYIKEVNIDAMLKFIIGDDDLEHADLKANTIAFLESYGMSERSINILIDKLCK